MRKLGFAVVALVCVASAPLRADSLAEVRKTFTIGGKPIPPEVFSDFGDAMLSDSRPSVVAIDANAAIDSNRYADPMTTKGRWVIQEKPASGSLGARETMACEFRGATANGLIVIQTEMERRWRRSVSFPARARRRAAGRLRRRRLPLPPPRTHRPAHREPGGRLGGQVSVSGNSIRIITDAPRGGSGAPPQTIEARSP